MITIRSTHYTKEEIKLLSNFVDDMTYEFFEEFCSLQESCGNCKYRTLCKDIQLIQDHLQQLKNS